MTGDLLPLILTALALGLLGGGHCIGMCGGLMGALTLAIPVEQRRGWQLWRILLGYNFGRIISYATAGALLGSLGWLLRDLGLDLTDAAIQRIIADEQYMTVYKAIQPQAARPARPLRSSKTPKVTIVMSMVTPRTSRASMSVAPTRSPQWA